MSHLQDHLNEMNRQQDEMLRQARSPVVCDGMLTKESFYQLIEKLQQKKEG